METRIVVLVTERDAFQWAQASVVTIFKSVVALQLPLLGGPQMSQQTLKLTWKVNIGQSLDLVMLFVSSLKLTINKTWRTDIYCGDYFLGQHKYMKPCPSSFFMEVIFDVWKLD